MADDTKTWMRRRNADVRAKRLASASPSRIVDVSDLNHSAAVKAAAGSLAETAGVAAGVARGGARLAKDAVGAVQFTENMLDPSYGLLHGGRPAWLPLAQSADKAIHQGWSSTRHPIRSIKQRASRANVALNPFATPVAPTVAGEVRRRFDIGKNQGEMLFDVGASAAAPEGAASPFLSAEEQVAKRMANGMREPVAQVLAEPYTGSGHHFYPRAGLPSPKTIKKLPEFLHPYVKSVKLPKSISDSPFNVLKPPGISRGDMYDLHYEVDSDFNGARLPNHVGEHWSGAKAGLEKKHPLVRVVRGAPTALKQVVKRTAKGAGGGLVGAADMDRGSHRP